MMTLALILIPLLLSIALFTNRLPNAKAWALVGSLVELALVLLIALQFENGAQTQFAFDKPWIQSLGIHFSVALDGISLLLVILTTALTPPIILSSFGSEERPASFYGLILLMEMALVGVFMAQDGMLFYLFWEMALIPVYFICLLWGGADRGRITLKFFIYTLAGSLLMLVAIIYLYFQTPGEHSFALQDLYGAGRSLSQVEQSYVFWAMFIAFAIKMPVFPFHTWQPDTYTVAPLQGTMLLSGIMLKMGIYGMIRWLIPMVPMGVMAWGSAAVVLSVIGIVYASCIALVQKDLKRLIAYSSIAHVGLISAGALTLSTTGLQGAMIQMLSHGVIVVALFFIVDVIDGRTKTRQLTELGGIRNVAPVFTSLFLIVMLGSVALPLTSGFVGEFLLINSIFQYSAGLGALAGLTIILGAVYMFKAFQSAMSGETNKLTAPFTDLTYREKLVLIPAVAIILLLGIFPGPLLAISEPAVNSLLTIFQDVSASIK